jgi:RNA polymerase sigma factor (sigma-70 family)
MSSPISLHPFTHNRETLAVQIDAYGQLVYSFAHRLTKDAATAETVVEKVFAALSRTYLKDAETLISWLLSATRKTSLQALNGSFEDASPKESLHWQEKGAAVKQALSLLTDKQKTLVQWFYFEGLSQYSIAKRLSMPQKTVNNQIRLALQQLKPHIHRGQEKLHAAVNGNLVDYLNVHLPAKEMAAFEQHLATCSICQKDLAEWQSLTEDLPYLSEELGLPSGMKERLLTAVFGNEMMAAPEVEESKVENEQAKEMTRPASEPAVPPKEHSFLPVLAAALVLAIGANSLLSTGRKKKTKRPKRR